MNYTDIHKKYDQISELILNYDISEAINLLFDFAGNTKKQYHHIKIEKIKEIKFPHSLGILYAAITKYLGFQQFGYWE